MATIGYGYGSGPLFEETSSAEHYYELMALARVLAEGLGLISDGQERPAFLSEVVQNIESARTENAQFFAQLVTTLGEIRDRIQTSSGGSAPQGLEEILQSIREELA